MTIDSFGGYALCRNDEDEEDDREKDKSLSSASPDTVIPSEYGKLVETCDKVPTRSNIPGDKDAERQDGEGVHELSAS